MTRVQSLQKSFSYVPLLDSSKKTESQKNESKKRSESKKKGEPKTSELDMNSKNTKKIAKIHPLLSVLGAKNRDKAAAKPAFLRYLEYIKEAGTWDESSDRPVMHFN